MNSMRFSYIVFALVGSMLIAFLVGVVIVTPREVARFAGLAFLLTGILNVLAYRRFGSQVFRWGVSLFHSDSMFWQKLGELGAQRLYLAIGLVMLITGFLLIFKGRALF
jgi:hypothetical protein